MFFKHFLFFILFFSFLNIYSQHSDHNLWIYDISENVKQEFTDKEIIFIKDAHGNSEYKRIVAIKGLEKYIKDILRNRVQILKKKFLPNENIKNLNSVRSKISPSNFSLNDFNPLLYNFDFESKYNQIYRIQGTDYIINIIPKKYK
tara:strand:+ start:10482 stop:10919 length:438 start_codon:yes stop_codon:yes gene_type:complete